MWEYCLVDFQDENIILQDSKDKITSQFGVLSIQRFPFTLYMKPNWMFFVCFFSPSKLFELIFFSFVIKDEKIFFVSLTMNFFYLNMTCEWRAELIVIGVPFCYGQVLIRVLTVHGIHMDWQTS